jgi:hypothetical protein
MTDSLLGVLVVAVLVGVYRLEQILKVLADTTASNRRLRVILKDFETRDAVVDTIREGVRAAQRQQARDAMASAVAVKNGLPVSAECIGEMSALNIHV